MTIHFKKCPRCELEFPPSDQPFKFCQRCGLDLEEAARKLEQIIEPIPPVHIPKPVNVEKPKKTAGVGSILIFIGLLILVCIVASAAFKPVPPSPTAIPYPTSTSRPPPYDQPTPPPTSVPNCLPSNQVTKGMAGQTLCVYGTVYIIEGCNPREYNNIGGCRFRTGDYKDFFFASGAYGFAQIKPGDCILAFGTILLSSEDVPYIDVDNKLYHCY